MHPVSTSCVPSHLACLRTCCPDTTPGVGTHGLYLRSYHRSSHPAQLLLPTWIPASSPYTTCTLPLHAYVHYTRYRYASIVCIHLLKSCRGVVTPSCPRHGLDHRWCSWSGPWSGPATTAAPSWCNLGTAPSTLHPYTYYHTPCIQGTY